MFFFCLKSYEFFTHAFLSTQHENSGYSTETGFYRTISPTYDVLRKECIYISISPIFVSLKCKGISMCVKISREKIISTEAINSDYC